MMKTIFLHTGADDGGTTTISDYFFLLMNSVKNIYFEQTDGRTDQQIDGQSRGTKVKQYAPNLLMLGH